TPYVRCARLSTTETKLRAHSSIVGLRELIGSTGGENDTHTQAMPTKPVHMWIGQAKVGPVRCPRHLSHLHLRGLPRPKDGRVPARRSARSSQLDYRPY